MISRIQIETPDGQQATHVRSAQNGDLELRRLADGGFEVLGVTQVRALRSHQGLNRPARREEEVLGTYPPGSTYTTI